MNLGHPWWRWWRSGCKEWYDKKLGNNESWTPVVEVVEVVGVVELVDERLQSVVLQEDRGTMNIGLSCWRWWR